MGLSSRKKVFLVFNLAFYLLDLGKFCLVKSDSTQVFERVASIYPHVSQAHLSVQINFTEGLHRLQSISTWLKGKEVGSSHFVRSTLAQMRAMVDSRHEEIQDYMSLFLHGSHRDGRRHKRQALAIAGLGLSVMSLLSQWQMRGTLGEIKDRQNLFARQIISVTNTTRAVIKDINRLKGMIDTLAVNLAQDKFLHQLQMTFQALEVDTTNFITGLETLMAGRLSLGLVDKRSAAKEMKLLKESCRRKGYVMAFDSPSQLFQLPVSFGADYETLYIIVSVPIIPVGHRAAFDLFRYRALPIFVDGQLIELQGEQDLIAFSQDYSNYLEISSAQLATCGLFGETYHCPFIGVIRATSQPTCLVNIFLAKEDDIAKVCQVRKLEKDFAMERLNATAVVVYSKKLMIGTLECGKHITQIPFRGFKVHDFPPGCSLHMEENSFTAAFNPVIEETMVYPIIKHDFFNFSASVEVSDKLKKELGDFEHIDYTEIVEGAKKIGKLNEWMPDSNWSFAWICAAVLGVMLVISLAAVVILYFCFRKRIFQNSSLAPRLKEVDHHSIARIVLNRMNDSTSQSRSLPKLGSKVERLYPDIEMTDLNQVQNTSPSAPRENVYETPHNN